MKKSLLLILLLMATSLSYSQSKIGIFDNHTDIGQPKYPGFASYDEHAQTYTIGGAGINMLGSTDQFK